MRNFFELTIQKSLFLSFLIHLSFLFYYPSHHRRAAYSVPLFVELVTMKSSENDRESVFRPQEIKRAKKTPVKKETVVQQVKKTVPAVSQDTTSLALDTQSFPFPYYISMIRKKVSEYWGTPKETMPRKCIIYFAIERDGQVRMPVVEQSSGVSFIDQACLRAVLGAAPFPPLPEEFREDQLGVYFGFKAD